jgi:hypothetical protein
MRATAKSVLASAMILLASVPALFSHARDRAAPGPERPPPCTALIKYRIGALDPRFGITSEELQRYIEKAGNVWQGDRTLFQYDPKGKLPINLVYDTRQQFTQQVIAARASVSAKIAEADLIENRLSPLRENFRILDAAYSDQATSFEQAQDRHRKKIKELNLSGGLSETDQQEMANERQALQKQFNLLEAKRRELNHAADELNELIKKHNELLKRANAEANAFNAGPANVKFEEGRYIREGREERIDIFQFENTDKLIVILAHELGHALGMKHNSNPASVMSPLIHTDRLALTAEDEDGLKTVCW